MAVHLSHITGVAREKRSEPSSVTDTIVDTIVSRDPATGEELGRVPKGSAAEVTQAVERACAAQKAWGKLRFGERALIVERAREIALSKMDQIADLISRETGKPVAEALAMEIVPTLDLMQHFAKHTARLLRRERINIGQYGLLGRSSHIVYHPLGVIGIISPWNFPWAIPMGEVVMALMAGNAVVLKPSELTPLVGLKIGEVFAEAGLPSGLLQVVTGDGTTGAWLVKAAVNKIMFTGSVATGKRVAAAAVENLTPVVLELGGKDPLLVFEDADVEVAARAAVWGAFANAGQACASIERCYVHKKVAPQFIHRVIEETRSLRQGLGTNEDTDIGAMSSENQLLIVEEHVRSAIKQGARLLIGGQRHTPSQPPRLSSNPFYEPTVLVNVDHTMSVMREETFGPVLPIMMFESEDEAIRLANDSHYGLTASVWTKDLQRGRRIASRIEAGTLMVNEVLYTHGIAQTPWGGVKQSGIGRTHGRLGLLELVTPQHIHINHFARSPDLWWFSYTPAARRLFRGFAERFTSGSVRHALPLLPQILRRLFEHRL